MSGAKQWALKKESEMRCEIQETQTLILKLVSGSAEIFGVEMAQNREYTFTDQNVAVYTWYGCIIESSTSTGIYLDDSTPMIAYVNTHVQLQARRDVALNNNENGPRVMIVGPTDSGKSTIAQILTAYAVRMDRTPILVDLDVGQSSMSIPGCVSAALLTKSNLSAEEGFTNTTPLVYFYGHTTPKDNIELYNNMVTTLAEKVDERLSRDADAKASGLIVNTCGWVEGQQALDMMIHCIKTFSIDIILVIGQDKLHSSLVTAVGSSSGVSGGTTTTTKPVTVVKLAKSGGVVTRDSAIRKRLRKNKVKEYFYGRLSHGVTPYQPERRDNVPISSYSFLRVGGVTLTQGMTVIGDGSRQDTMKITRITPTADLAYSVVAVLNISDCDTTTSTGIKGEISQSFLKANVAGFVSILHLDIESGYMTLLCPCTGALPSHYLMVGSVKWIE